MAQCSFGYGFHSSDLRLLEIREILLMADTPKKVRPNKKALIKEIIENNDHFDIASLERTNINNLTEIKRLVLLTRG